MSKPKLNCRWRKGAERYSPAERQLVDKMREQPGWFHGARVFKVKK